MNGEEEREGIKVIRCRYAMVVKFDDLDLF
jgi:hypothetical protein